MNRDVVFGLAVLSITLLACGSSNPPAREGGGDIVRIATKDMGSDASAMPKTFARLSRKHGCAVSEEKNGVVAKCDGQLIALVRDGSVITVGCKSMTHKACSNLFSAIVDEGKH